MTEVALGAPLGWGGRVPLGRKVVLAVATLLALLTLTILLAVVLVARLGSAESHINSRNVPFATSVDAAALAAKGVANDERGFLMSGDRRYLGEAEVRIVRARTAFAAAAQAASTGDERRIVGQASDSFENWVVQLQEEFATYSKDHAAAISASLGETRELRKNYETDLASAQAQAATSIADGNASIAGSTASSRNLLLGCLVAVLAAGLVIAWWLVRLVALPVQRLLTVISDLGPDARALTQPAMPVRDREWRLSVAAETVGSGSRDARRDAAVKLARFLGTVRGEQVLSHNGFDSDYVLVLALSEDPISDVMTRVARHSRPVVIATYVPESGSPNLIENFGIMGVTLARIEGAPEIRPGDGATIGQLWHLMERERRQHVSVRVGDDQQYTLKGFSRPPGE